VVAAITDAEQIINTIERHTDSMFAAMPDPAKQKAVEQGIERCRLALQVALRSSQGAEELSEADAGAALAQFREAYAALLLLVEPLGVKQQGDGEPLLAASPGSLSVPPPLAMSLGR
jgi:hypothetical protein